MARQQWDRERNERVRRSIEFEREMLVILRLQEAAERLLAAIAIFGDDEAEPSLGDDLDELAAARREFDEARRDMVSLQSERLGLAG